VADAVEKRPATPPRRHARGHGARFALAYALVLVLFGAMTVLFAFLVSQAEAPPWSAYEPHGKGLDRAQDIANHVSRRYREDGETIAAIDAQPPIVQDTLVDAIATARPKTAGVGGGYERVEPAEGAVMYVFCGLARRCEVPGTPSVEREQLLRRASLELALYTFKYMDDIKSVVTILPPVQRQNEAVYLKRSSLSGLLDKPLAKTLPARGPFETGELTDVASSESLTADRFYTSQFQQLPNGLGLLVLTRQASG
jgi:hypothetical protein